ncbi:hypothetical protein ACGFYQ_36705 [Streptomyces sp. NPDC048258]|uniref:hypothetical protein n=1 Tax=Streptomyces sp. NPDC048258 TaxID=3365527 RepID=UPI00371E9C7C
MEHEQTAPEQQKGAETGPRRPRRRTLLLIAGAATLGILAGTVTGYAIQYHRAPTPLPPLAQQSVDVPEPLPADESTSLRTINANRWHKTDDDLTKLLVEAPGGVEVSYSGAEPLDEFAADYYENPGSGLRGILTRHVRRIATLRWKDGDHNVVTVRLKQFYERAGAEDHRVGYSFMSEPKFAGNPGKDLPGVPAAFGHLWVDSKVRQTPGYQPVQSGRAVARRGDIVMDVKIQNNRGDLDETALAELAKRQWERL